MNYRVRQKERRMRLTLAKIFHTFNFKSKYLSFWGKTVLFWSIILFISLFMPWIKQTWSGITWNSFSSITGNIWYIIFTFIFIILFLLLSNRNKEKIKLHINISFQNYFLILLFWAFTIIICIMSLSFINGLHTFQEDIIYQKGWILALSSWILITFWWYLLRKEYLTHNLWVFVDNDENIISQIDKKRNMKLPF